MVLAEIRDLIRGEANIQGLKEYGTIIDAAINQELSRLTGKSRYEDLRTFVPFTTSADEQFTFSLPEDVQHIVSVSYTAYNSNCSYLLGRGVSSFVELHWQGFPKFYARSGANLLVYPYSNIYINDAFQLDYYKKVILTLDGDEFPVISLEQPVIQAVMARMLAMTDTTKAQFAKQLSEEAYKDSRAENAGF